MLCVAILTKLHLCVDEYPDNQAQTRRGYQVNHLSRVDRVSLHHRYVRTRYHENHHHSLLQSERMNTRDGVSTKEGRKESPSPPVPEEGEGREEVDLHEYRECLNEYKMNLWEVVQFELSLRDARCYREEVRCRHRCFNSILASSDEATLREYRNEETYKTD